MITDLKTKSGFEEYGKGNSNYCDLLAPEHETAKQNAQELCEQAAKTGDDNPSTRMHELVAVLESDEVRGR